MLTDSLAQLFAAGQTIDWQGFHQDRPQPRPVHPPLPTYPFGRQAHWLPDPIASTAVPSAVPETTVALEPARPAGLVQAPVPATAGRCP